MTPFALRYDTVDNINKFPYQPIYLDHSRRRSNDLQHGHVTPKTSLPRWVRLVNIPVHVCTNKLILQPRSSSNLCVSEVIATERKRYMYNVLFCWPSPYSIQNKRGSCMCRTVNILLSSYHTNPEHQNGTTIALFMEICFK